MPNSPNSRESEVQNILSVFRKDKPKNTAIKEDMTPEQVADIISDSVINKIKEQFSNQQTNQEQKP